MTLFGVLPSSSLIWFWFLTNNTALPSSRNASSFASSPNASLFDKTVTCGTGNWSIADSPANAAATNLAGWSIQTASTRNVAHNLT